MGTRIISLEVLLSLHLAGVEFAAAQRIAIVGPDRFRRVKAGALDPGCWEDCGIDETRDDLLCPESPPGCIRKSPGRRGPALVAFRCLVEQRTVDRALRSLRSRP